MWFVFTNSLHNEPLKVNFPTKYVVTQPLRTEGCDTWSTFKPEFNRFLDSEFSFS